MELNLQVTKIKVRLGDEAWELRRPSVRELKEFAAAKGEDLDKTIDLLAKCGLPCEVTETLDVESLQAVVDTLTPKKKS